jgi:hypothetical protein
MAINSSRQLMAINSSRQLMAINGRRQPMAGERDKGPAWIQLPGREKGASCRGGGKGEDRLQHGGGAKDRGMVPAAQRLRANIYIYIYIYIYI